MKKEDIEILSKFWTQDTEYWVRKYIESKDKVTKDKIWTEHLHIPVNLFCSYILNVIISNWRTHNVISFEDLLQDGIEFIYKSIDKYKPKNSNSKSYYYFFIILKNYYFTYFKIKKNTAVQFLIDDVYENKSTSNQKTKSRESRPVYQAVTSTNAADVSMEQAEFYELVKNHLKEILDNTNISKKNIKKRILETLINLMKEQKDIDSRSLIIHISNITGIGRYTIWETLKRIRKELQELRIKYQEGRI